MQIVKAHMIVFLCLELVGQFEAGIVVSPSTPHVYVISVFLVPVKVFLEPVQPFS